MIRVIVAVDQRMGIAKHGGQPWNIPDDEAYFSRLTKSEGGVVLMGKTQLKLMGRALEGRTNFVLSHNDTDIPDVKVVSDLAEFLDSYANKDLWVMGGASIYEQVMSLGKADLLYVTHIAADFKCDQFFPAISPDMYVLKEQSELQQENGFTFRYAVYQKK